MLYSVTDMVVTRKWKIIISCAVIYVGIILSYYAGRSALKAYGLEYRSFVPVVVEIIKIGCPLALIAGLMIYGCIYASQKKKKFIAILLVIVTVLYSISALLLFLFYMILSSGNDYEQKAPDGNLVISIVDNSFLGEITEIYYAEPVALIARRRFDWDEDRVAVSLSKIYGTYFEPVNEKGYSDKDLTYNNVFYVSDDYPGVKVQVCGIGSGNDEYDYIQNNFRYQYMSQRIDRFGRAFLKSGAVKIVDYEEFRDFSDKEAAKVNALLIEEGREMEAAKEISSFISEEKESGVWHRFSGSIFLLGDIKGIEEPLYLQNMAVGGHEERYFGDLTDENAVKEKLDRAIEQKKEWHERELEREQESKRLEEEVDTSIPANSAYEEMMKGYQAIYDSEFKEKGAGFTEDMTAKGDIYIILEDTGNSVSFLAYDRDSNNNKCGLYVYQSCIKNDGGSWSVQDAEILDIFAYVYDTGEVISSGRKAWTDTGNEAYCEATGE